jgi:hypothetical protein
MSCHLKPVSYHTDNRGQRNRAGRQRKRQANDDERTPTVLALLCAVVLASSACSAATRTRTSPWWAGVQKPGAVRSGGFLAGPFGIDEQGFAAAYQQAGRRSEAKMGPRGDHTLRVRVDNPQPAARVRQAECL